MDIVENNVKAIIANLLAIDQEGIANNATFIEDLGVDSLHTVEMITAFEEEFSVDITDEEAEAIETVQMAIDFIKAKQSATTS